jgi:hypothetical protein
MKFGIIAVGRDCAGVIDEVLAPWIESFRRHDMHICLLSATFKEMEGLLPAGPDKATEDAMERYALKYSDRISSVMFRNYATEAEVRERGRQVLMARDVKADLVWILDCADELYTVEQIDRIIRFVEHYPLMAWYKLSFKNYVFNDHTYLVQPFQPPRIWWCKYGERVLTQCSYDNDFEYAKLDGTSSVKDDKLPSLVIPPNVVWIRHLSWLSNERSRLKVAYQAKHFGHGAGCSYRWDESTNSLTWNQAYFDRLKLPLPEVVHE